MGLDTLVLVVDRPGDVARHAATAPPVAGEDAVRSLVYELGLADPEDSGVNSLLEGLRLAAELREGGEQATVAVVSGGGRGSGVGGGPDGVSGDRAVAAQLDELLGIYEPDSAVVVIDSAEDEQLVSVVESRVPVDAVDRVVVRQARDLESTYYLLKQFLADEELRESVLVPLGTVLLVFPALLTVTGSVAMATAAITAVLGLFLLYKGLGVEEALSELPGRVRTALYDGQVSVVTYVVAGGLALIGSFVGALSASALGTDPPLLLAATAFAYRGVPWLAGAALAASAGQLLDQVIQHQAVRTPYVNLPFGVVAVALVVRGFSAYFLERGGEIGALRVPATSVGVLRVEAVTLTPEQRLAAFVLAGVVVSLVGVQVANRLGGTEVRGPDELPER
ncbi:MAG: DUF373 family protein [Halobacteriaceae archaeon]